MIILITQISIVSVVIRNKYHFLQIVSEALSRINFVTNSRCLLHSSSATSGLSLFERFAKSHKDD